MDYVYEFIYNSCVYESSARTMSIHKSISGAYKAMKTHRLKTYNEWRKQSREWRKPWLDTHDQHWGILKTKLEN